MSKIHAYQPRRDFKNYLYPTTKPFKSGAIGYQQRVWTLQEQIYFQLKKIAHFIDLLFENSTNAFKEPVSKIVKKNIELLHKDIELLKHSLGKELIGFSKEKLKVNEHWIVEMKTIIDKLKSSLSDDNESKILHKLTHMLNELDHLIKPKLHEIQEIKSIKIAPVKKKVVKVAHKPTRKAAVVTKKLAPAKKSLVKTKVVKAKLKAKPIKKVSKKVKAPQKPDRKAAVATKKLTPAKKSLVKAKVVKAKLKAKPIKKVSKGMKATHKKTQTITNRKELIFLM